MNPPTKEIIDACLVPKHRMTYAIGCFERRITIYSQQIRAFNLAFSIIQEKLIAPDSELAIIGGGISGMTIAAAFASKGHRVCIYESASELMHMQRGAKNRFIHPTIYDWPTEQSVDNETDLPFLNWKSDFTHKVVDVLDEQFLKYSNKVTIKSGCRITRLIEKDRHVVLEIQDARYEQDKPNTKQRNVKDRQNHPIVIYAGGFGIEKSFTKHFKSYWRNESLDQPLLSSLPEKKVAIAGTGDGGLIDCQRAVIKNYDHEKYLGTILNSDEFRDVCEKIKTLEENIPNNIPLSVQCEKLWHIYENQPLSNDLMSLVAGTRRTDIKEVLLFGEHPNPLSLNTSLINRVVVYILLHKAYIKYNQQKLNVNDLNKLKKNGYDVIERLGTEPFLLKLFPSVGNEIEAIEKKKSLLNILSIGTVKYWELIDDFYHDLPIEKVQKSFLVVYNIGQVNSSRIIESVKKKISELTTENNLHFVWHELPINPQQSLFQDNLSNITQKIKNLSPDFILVLSADLFPYLNQIETSSTIIILGEDVFTHKFWEQRKNLENPLVAISQPVDASRLLSLISKISGIKSIGFVYDEEFALDKEYFDILKTAAENTKSDFNLTLVPVSLSNLTAISSLDHDLLIGRYFVHQNSNILFDQKPFISVFEADVDHGAIASLDTDLKHISETIAKAVSQRMLNKQSNLRPYYTTKKPRIILNSRHAKKWNISLSEELKASAELIFH